MIRAGLIVLLLVLPARADERWQAAYPEGPAWIGGALYWAEMMADRVMVWQDGAPKVFVVEGGAERSVARARTIRTGRSEGDWIEVLEGLAEGERVIFDGQFALEDGSIVQIDGAIDAVAAGQPE